MKKYLSIVLLALTVNSSFAAENDPIVDVNVVEEFGIWRVYNDGTYIYFSDKEDKHYLKVGFTTNDPVFSGPDGRLLLHDTGTAGQLGFIDDNHPYALSAAKALEIEPSGHLQAGRYGFGDKQFIVTEDSITVFNKGNKDSLGNIFPSTVLKKYSNGIVREGTSTSTIVEATKVLDKNNIAGPAAVLGDCNAKYDPATGILSIPCFSIGNDRTVHQINLNQIPDTVDFSADLQTFIRVQ
jgi:hypothetical protein